MTKCYSIYDYKYARTYATYATNTASDEISTMPFMVKYACTQLSG